MAGGDQQAEQEKGKEDQSSVTVERGEQKIVEVEDKWVKIRVTMGSGAVGHVMPETMFPRVKLERKRTAKSLWLQMDSKTKTGVRKNPIQDKRGNPEVQNIQKCRCCPTLHFNAKGRPSWKHCCAG